MENLEFDNFDYISEQKADFLEREFKKDEVKVAFFKFGGDKALGSDGFPLAFFLKQIREGYKQRSDGLLNKISLQ